MVYEGRGFEFLDKDLEKGKHYFYAVYTFNRKGEFSKPVLTDVFFGKNTIEAKVIEPDLEKPGMEPEPIKLSVFQRIWQWILSIFK